MTKSDENRSLTVHLTDLEWIAHIEAARKAKMTPSEYGKLLMAKGRLPVQPGAAGEGPTFVPVVSIGGVTDENMVALVDAIRFSIPYAMNDMMRRDQKVAEFRRAMDEQGAEGFKRLAELAVTLGMPEEPAEPAPVRSVEKSIRALRSAGQSPAEIAKSLGVSREDVRKVLFAA